MSKIVKLRPKPQKFEEIIAERNQLKKQLAETLESKPKLQAEIDRFMETTELDDEAAIQLISGKKIMLDLIPHQARKIEQYLAEVDEIETSLKPTYDDLDRAFSELLVMFRDEVTRRLTVAARLTARTEFEAQQYAHSAPVLSWLRHYVNGWNRRDNETLSDRYIRVLRLFQVFEAKLIEITSNAATCYFPEIP